jgi:hypothetical protein
MTLAMLHKLIGIAAWGLLAFIAYATISPIQDTPDRHGRIPDAIEKMAGGVVGIAVGQAILLFGRATSWFQN